MKRFYFLLLLVLFMACSQNENATIKRTTDFIRQPLPKINLFKAKLDTAQHIANYEKLKVQIKSDRQQMIAQGQSTDSAADYLFSILNDSIFRYWDGTSWDFNGITQTPKKGQIACGYFVTTTLRDVGIKLQRYKLAQQAAADITKKLCAPKSIKWFNSIESLDLHITENGNNQLYILGLDYHVGFILRKDNINYFVHSSYMGDVCVVRETLLSSPAVHNSNAYIVGNVLENEILLNMWLGQ